MNKKLIRLTESDLHRIVKESVNKVLNEVSADLADRAADKGYLRAREKGKYPYVDTDEFNRAEKFLKYRNEKLGIHKGFQIFYVDGKPNGRIALKDPNGNVVTKPCNSVKELEADIKSRYGCIDNISY